MNKPQSLRSALNKAVAYVRDNPDKLHLFGLRDNQPDAINNPALREKLFTFDVDILRNDVCDISLNLQLTERVLVSTDGSVSSVEAVAEPDEPEEMWTVKRG
ncbi:phage tail protein [Salmonella enterica subsp. enterica serovar Typhi]|nr:phage tail protein [Salmonella enterica subsp. enterica serovar Typhi]